MEEVSVTLSWLFWSEESASLEAVAAAESEDSDVLDEY
jgi:hypothetical protein